MIKMKKLDEELVEWFSTQGYNKMISCILANRNKDLIPVKPLKKIIPDLDKMVDLTKGSEIVYKNILEKRIIVVVTDYDCDGVSSAGLLYKGLTEYFSLDQRHLIMLVNERRYGNGVNDHLVTKIKDINSKTPIGCIITADHGSSDANRLELLLDFGIDIVVTDHHIVPEHKPRVSAFINPQQDGCEIFRGISGCTVAFLLMKQLYNLALIEDFDLGKHDEMDSLLPFVALTVISDVMSLDNPVNRYYLITGLRVMNMLDNPIWKAIHKSLWDQQAINEQTLGFSISPLINSPGRMEMASKGLELFKTTDIRNANTLVRELTKINNERKRYQAKLLKIARKEILFRFESHPNSLVIVLKEGEGVAGILSGKLGDEYQRPIFTLTRLSNGNYTGSGRGIVEGVDMYQTLCNIHNENSEIFVKFGGHKMAAGCTIREDQLDNFINLFDKFIEVQNIKVGEKIVSCDFELPLNEVNYKTLEDIKSAGPYGSKWKYPVLYAECEIIFKSKEGKDKDHLRLKVKTDDNDKELQTLFMIFGVEKCRHIKVGDKVKIGYSPRMTFFRGVYKIEPMLEAIELIE